MEKIIKKLVHVNGQDMHSLDAGGDIVKTLNIKDYGKIQLTIRNNFKWGCEKP